MKSDLNLYLNSHDKDVIGYKVKNNFYLIGPSNYYNSWFSNIQLLEGKNFFSKKLPLISHHLYYGKLRLADILKAQQELSFIKKKFKKIPVSSIIWDIKDRSTIPAWPTFVEFEKNKNLYDFYVSIDGKT